MNLILVPSIPQQARPTAWHPAFYLAIVYIFVTYTRLPEFIPLITGGRGIRLALLMTILAVLVILLSGGIYRIFSSKIVLAMMAFTIWMFLSTPFSVWRGGSAGQVISWCGSFITLILLAGCIEGSEQCRKAGYTMAVAVLVIEGLSFVMGSSAAGAGMGRFAFTAGTFANPNDFAALLLMGIPFCLLVVRTNKGLAVLKMFCVLGLLLIPVSALRTGSRGGLLALVIMFVLFFFSVSSIQRVPLAIVASAGGCRHYFFKHQCAEPIQNYPAQRRHRLLCERSGEVRGVIHAEPEGAISEQRAFDVRASDSGGRAGDVPGGRCQGCRGEEASRRMASDA